MIRSLNGPVIILEEPNSASLDRRLANNPRDLIGKLKKTGIGGWLDRPECYGKGDLEIVF